MTEERSRELHVLKEEDLVVNQGPSALAGLLGR